MPSVAEYGCVRLPLLLLLLLLVHRSCGQDSYDTLQNAPSKAEIAEKVSHLFQDFFAWRLEDNPEFATRLGNHTYDRNLSSYSMSAYELRWNRCQEYLEELKVIEVLSQSFTDKINMEILRESVATYIRGFDHMGYLLPISYLDGVGTGLAQIVEFMKFDTEEDYRTLLARLQEFPRQAGEIQALMEEGIQQNMTLHKVSMNTVPEQFRALDVPLNQSDFYAPFLNMPDSLSEDVKQQLRNEAEEVIKRDVIGNFRDLANFIENEYLPNTRESIAATSLPNGENYYRECLRFHTSGDLTAEEIHQIGLKEVDRIEANMKKVVDELGLKDTSVSQFSERLRTNRSNYYETSEALIAGFTSLIRDRIRPLMDKVVLEMPRTDVIVDVLPDNQKDGISASYQIPAFDGSRPGKFKINKYIFDQQPKYEMTALSAHESNPGHHLYFSYLVEKTGLPDFRRRLDQPAYSEVPSGFPLNTAIVEGWALYSEYLGHEMGLYEDPIDRYGRYSQEIFRACRLVVDTGIHAFNWTQERAVDYMLEHTASSRVQIENEVRRYITWPGQATAYKIGELRLKELRQRAERQLGDRFDVRVFHKVVLDCAGPLAVVEQCVSRYIAADGVWDAWGQRTLPGGRVEDSAAAAAPLAVASVVAAAAVLLRLL